MSVVVPSAPGLPPLLRMIGTLKRCGHVLRRSITSPAFRIAVGLGLLVWLFTKLDLRALPAAVAGVRLDLLALVAAIILATRLIGAFRWYVLLRGLHQDVSYRAVMRLTFVSDFVGYFTPGSLGVEATRLYGMARITSNPALSATSILTERMVAFLALIFLVLAGLAFDLAGIPREVGTLAWLALGLLLAGAIGLMAAPFRSATLWLLSHPRLLRASRTVEKVYASLDHYRARPLLLGGTFAIATVFQILRCAAVALCALAFGVELPFVFYIVIVPVVNLITLIPISIAGLGVRELGFVYLFGRVGMSPEVAVSVSVVIRILTILLATPGVWLYARRGVAPVTAAADDRTGRFSAPLT